jgi:hypothetical protein
MQLPKEEGGDAYYVIELVRRGKDNPDLPAANYHFKNYYIDTLKKYDSVQDEIRTLCRTFRLRAYVSVNRKSFRQVTLNTIAEMSRRAALDDFRRPYAVFESCSGKFVNKDDKYWVVDVDDCDWKTIVYIEHLVEKCKPEGNKAELILPTRSGCHLITRPFDVGEFQLMMKEKEKELPEIKKNHLTLLYEEL